MTWGVYWQTLTFDFVNYDDHTYLTENPRVLQGLTGDNLVWAFSTTYFGNWHPLTWLSYMLDARLFGKSASGFHFTNLVWHTANVLLLFVVLRKMTGAIFKSAFVAALFAIHPLHVESVAWISERKDLLATFFGLLSVWAYCRYARQPKAKWYLMALAAFLFSLMSKQTLVTLPFLLLLFDYWPLQRLQAKAGDDSVDGQREQTEAEYRAIRGSESSCPPRPLRSLVTEKLPFFGLTLLFCVVVFVAQHRGGAINVSEPIPPPTRIANAVVVYVLYIKNAIWPFGLAAFYPHPGESISTAAVVVAALLLLLLTIAVIALARRRPYLPIGWFWYLGTLVPMIGLVQVGSQQMADRYTYLPLVGLFICVTWLIPSLLSARLLPQSVLAGLAVSTLGFFMAAAWIQTSHWRNSILLFEHALAVTEHNGLAETNLGNALYDLGRLDEAASHYERALDFNPNSALVHTNMGRALRELGHVDEAIDHFRQALRIDAKFVPAHLNLGSVLHQSGHTDQAVRHYETVLEIDKQNALAHTNLGSVHQELGRFERAETYHARAVQLDPELALARYNLGGTLHELGRLDEAARQYLQALRIEPDDAKVHNNLGNVLDELGRLDRALEHYRRAVQLAPEDPQVHNNLGIFFIVRRGNRELAIQYFREALRLDPNFSDARENLRRALDQ